MDEIPEEISDPHAEFRWKIMASILSTNMAVMLFQGLQQEIHFSKIREIVLGLVAMTIPFQVIFFLLHAHSKEFGDTFDAAGKHLLLRLQGVCQGISYISLIGIVMLWWNLSVYIGIMFGLSVIIAIIMVRLAISQTMDVNAHQHRQ